MFKFNRVQGEKYGSEDAEDLMAAKEGADDFGYGSPYGDFATSRAASIAVPGHSEEQRSPIPIGGFIGGAGPVYAAPSEPTEPKAPEAPEPASAPEPAPVAESPKAPYDSEPVREAPSKAAVPQKERRRGPFSRKRSFLTPAERRDRERRGDGRKLALFCGAMAAVTVFSIGFSAVTFTTGQDMIDAASRDMVSCIVPTEDAPSGTILTEDMLETIQVPAAFVPTDAATKIQDIVGRAAVTNLTEGVPVSLSAIVASPDPADITTAISKGHVAKMFALEGASAMSPFLSPGDYVTITYAIEGSGIVETRTMEHVRIVAVGAQLSGNPTDDYTSLTFELTPQQVDELSHASDMFVTAEPRSEWPDPAADTDEGKGGDEAEEGSKGQVKDEVNALDKRKDSVELAPDNAGGKKDDGDHGAKEGKSRPADNGGAGDQEGSGE